ncbi:MAG: hypothetical protein R3Y35_02955 [Clostridia bacterium]
MIQEVTIMNSKINSIIVFSFLGFTIFLNLVQIVVYFKKGFSHIRHNIFICLVAIAVIFIFYSNIENLLLIIPLALIWWSFTLSLSSLISFFQYRKEKSSAPFRYLISALMHAGFGIPFSYLSYKHMRVGSRLIALYLILLGVTLIIDALAQVMPNKTINNLKNHVKITPPSFLTTLMPLSLIDNINEYFEKNEEEEIPLVMRSSDKKSRVEVLIHFAPSLKGTGGHIDLVIDGTIICYGTYDKQDIKLGGILGAGVFYEVYNKDDYIDYCEKVKNETLFGFELAVTDEETEKIIAKLDEFKKRTSPWKCRAQIAKEKGEDPSIYTDNPCRLSMRTETKFFKFHSGRYKYYWITGDNCVKFVDELLRATGIKTIFAGIIIPGSYYTFLNDEFLKGNGLVTSKTIYIHSK